MSVAVSQSSKENWVRRAPGALHRIEARYAGAAFAPHRHDTYAIGFTLGGVQTFDYRGAARHSLPGQMVVLYPDEVHDGRAGSEGAVHYRTLYLEPTALQTILCGKPLPFIDGGVSSDPRLQRALLPLLEDYRRPLDKLECEDALCALADTLDTLSRGRDTGARCNHVAAQAARAYLDANLEDDVALEDLEVIAGYDRWQLSRDFRKLFGTSPYRYRILRRLDKARALMVAGFALADVAAACAFAGPEPLHPPIQEGVWSNAESLAGGVALRPGDPGRTIVL